MSPDRDDEMPAEFDMTSGVRGKYVERYRRWACRKAGITDAAGTVEVFMVTSAGESSAVAIVLPQPEFVFPTTQAPQERRDVIATAANAV